MLHDESRSVRSALRSRLECQITHPKQGVLVLYTLSGFKNDVGCDELPSLCSTHQSDSVETAERIDAIRLWSYSRRLASIAIMLCVALIYPGLYVEDHVFDIWRRQ